MAYPTNESKNTILTLKHRAICKKDNYVGDWYYNIKDAKLDGERHRKENPNDFHSIEIDTIES